MNVLVLVPFKEEHMARIREAAGSDADVVQMAQYRTGKPGQLVSEPKLRAPRKPGDDGEVPPDPLTEAVMQADIIIGEPHPRLLQMEDLPLKWLQTTWAGVDMYTRGRYPFPEGVALTNVAGTAYGHIISQFVVGQVISIAQGLAQYARQQQTKVWADLGPVMSLEGANVLVYGAGDIGQCVAKRLSGFDVARIVGVCRDTSKPRPGFDELVSLPRAESLLPESDIVIGCIPDAPDTAGYFGARRLRLIKEGGMLVNVGRGSFVDGEALDHVLNEGHLRGAALDVCDTEPLPLKHPLWRNARCIITPHVSGGAFGKSEGTEERICQVCCDNLRRYMAGDPLTHQVL